MWKILWIIIVLNILIYNHSAVSSTAFHKGQSSIIYPKNESSDDCYINETQQIKGKCKALIDCPLALHRLKYERIPPKTCYFKQFVEIVCCDTSFDELNSHLLVTKKRPSEEECARSLEENPPDIKYLIYGEPTEPGEFRYMVALGWSSKSNSSIIYRCGGALITKRFVLTAAHCTDFDGESPKLVRIGGGNLTDINGSDIHIKKIIIHPTFDYTSSYNDIALIELQEASNKSIICLWSKPQVPNINVIAIGYGHTQFGGKGSNQLLKANLNIVSNNICRTHYEPDSEYVQQGILGTQICAGDPEHLRDTCQGDSGGPIIIKYNKQDYIVGITSFGQGCAGQPPSVYTRISAYIDWIENIVWPTKQ